MNKYIAFELQSPENASGQLDRLEEQILSLDTMPERYRKVMYVGRDIDNQLNFHTMQ